MNDPLRFPKRMTIELEDFHREGLEEIADRVPHEDDDELVQVVLSRGIVAMLASAFDHVQRSAEEVMHNLSAAKQRAHELRWSGSFGASELSSRGVRPFPAPFRDVQEAKETARRRRRQG